MVESRFGGNLMEEGVETGGGNTPDLPTIHNGKAGVALAAGWRALAKGSGRV